MTPYAILLVRSGDGDDVISRRFQSLSKSQHPDRPGAGGEPGPEWYAIANAYTVIRYADARLKWKEAMRMLSGLCSDCKGYGTVGSRVLGSKVRVCGSCQGVGRTSPTARQEKV